MSRTSDARRTVAALFLVTAPLWACGPFFPDRALVDRPASLKRAPHGDFERELASIAKRPAPPPPQDTDERTGVAAIDLAELTEALQASEAKDPGRLLGWYAALRKGLDEHAARAFSGGYVLEPFNHGVDLSRALPQGLPGEFDDYLRGALLYHQNKIEASKKAFRALFDRPEVERRRRSTWAAFMLGKLYLHDDPAEAARWFQETRALAASGFADSLHLAAESYGWEALPKFERGDLADAATLYLREWEAGGARAAPSLRMIAQRVLAATDPSDLARLSQEPVLRKVVILWLASSGDTEALANGTSAASRLVALWLEDSQGQKDVEGADRLAWALYRAGQFKRAEEWIKRADPSSGVTRWIHSKLLVRAGHLDAAARELGAALRLLPPDPSLPKADDEVRGFNPRRALPEEMAILELRADHYEGALQLLLRSGSWRDAAYVAERVLTAAALQAFVEKNYPETSVSAEEAETSQEPFSPTVTAHHLRYVLGRRLVREGKMTEALPFFPPDRRPRLEALIQALAASKHGSVEERGKALFEAAVIERKEGMELRGMELGPDYTVDAGDYDEQEYFPAPKKGQPTLINERERARVKASTPTPDKRFHYRYLAAEDALRAAKLMPQGSQEASDMLCTAYQWLSARDPKAAARYSRAWRLRTPTGTCP